MYNAEKMNSQIKKMIKLIKEKKIQNNKEIKLMTLAYQKQF